MPSEMVGTKSAALFASRMSYERSADELRPRKMERVNGVAPSSQPWHGRILLLNHTRVGFWICDLRFMIYVAAQEMPRRIASGMSS